MHRRLLLLYRTTVILIIVAAILPHGTRAAPQIFPPEVIISDHAKCFSCMSRLYESVWPILQNIYRRPKNFTEACDDIENHHDFVQYDFCPTICISMAEELNIGGVVIRGHIRGCKDNILLKGKEGFNRTIVERYRWLKRDSCNLYPKKELLELPGNYADHSKIQVCTCYDDHCNGSSAGSTIISSFPGFIVLLVLACLRL